MIPEIDIKHATQGHWPRILLSLGLPPEVLRNRHQPCPVCGGKDRFRFDDKDGRGTYFCNQCGPGDGFDLAMKYQGWDFKKCADEVRQILSNQPPANLPKVSKPYTPSQKGTGVTFSAKSPTRDYALSLWRESQSLESWDAAVADHPYAIRKRIKHAAGARRSAASGRLIGRDADCLLIPQRTLEGDLVGVECIAPEGVKQTFGNKGILILGNDLDPKLPQLVCEGWATAAAMLNLYCWNAVVYAAFGKGMLEKLALQIAERYPQRTVIVAGESDA